MRGWFAAFPPGSRSTQGDKIEPGRSEAELADTSTRTSCNSISNLSWHIKASSATLKHTTLCRLLKAFLYLLTERESEEGREVRETDGRRDEGGRERGRTERKDRCSTLLLSSALMLMFIGTVSPEPTAAQWHTQKRIHIDLWHLYTQMHIPL